MFLKCISSNEEEERPSVLQLIYSFYIEFYFVVFRSDDVLTGIYYENDDFTFYLFMMAECEYTI